MQVEVAVGGAVERVAATVGIARPKPQLSPVVLPLLRALAAAEAKCNHVEFSCTAYACRTLHLLHLATPC